MISDIRKFFKETDKTSEGNSRNSKDPNKSPTAETPVKTNGKVNPVIVTFQNGDLINGSDFNVSLTANKHGGTNVILETSYGHVFKESNKMQKPKEKQTILVRNRKTNKVKIIEVNSALLINSALLYTPETETTEMDFAQKSRNLNKTFGGKKIIARLEQREKLNVSSLPIADDVKKVLEEVNVEETVVPADTEADSIIHVLPPCHRETAVLSEVYVMEEILTEEELQVLKNEMAAMDAATLNSATYSEFFRSCYTEAKKTKENLDIRLAGLLFAETLIKFLRIQTRKLAAKNVTFCQFSSVIHEKILNNFCVKNENSITRPVTMKDKSLCYIMAISLISCNYKINLKLLSVSAAEHLKKLTRLARAVGAVPVPKQENVYALKLPLPELPKTVAARRRKK